MKKKILIAIVITATAVGLYGYKEFTRKNKDLAEISPDIKISTGELIRAFEVNEKEANTKYLDKVIAVTGKIKEVNKDDKGFYTVVLGEEKSMSSVRCSIDPKHSPEVSSLTQGQQVMMKGACTGFNADELLGSDVILNRAVIQNKNNN